MPEPQQPFRYVAVDRGGRRVKGVVTAEGEGGAFERLRESGFSPIELNPTRAKPEPPAKKLVLNDTDTVDLVGNLGHLLSAGADIRTALNILGARTQRKALVGVCKGLIADIGGGGALDAAFEHRMVRHGPFIGAMVAAGEASGDLPGGLTRAAEIIESRAKLRGRLGSTLAYPAFVLVSTVAAVLALLLFVIPALAPLVQGSEAPPPATLSAMIAASDLLRGHGTALGVLAVVLLAVGLLAHRAGLLGRLLDRLLMERVARRTMGSLVFGGFSIVAGGMLAAGAPMSDTLRLASRSLSSMVARRRLEPAQQAVRQGQALSAALDGVKGFPPSIARLAAVGEATGSLGPMLLRGGKLEEDAAMARIERLGQLLGPMLIVVLGGLVGTLMASLLSGVSQLGQSALQ